MADILPAAPVTMTPLIAEIEENFAECTATDPSTPPFAHTDSTSFKDISDSRAELLARVQSLRKDLREWRGKLDNQELGELRNTLNVEVEQLKAEFQDLRVTLRKQLDVTAKLPVIEVCSEESAASQVASSPTNHFEEKQQQVARTAKPIYNMMNKRLQV
ncbi:hypothetical protein GOP47_0011703 [Adiantum capillus-veneris]|uniref:Uncharacterized protein n=1 Tax=Adiantum capillus-veneris TaxID=13818 RepID=A0A9D4ZHX3_ADICA|nr:hypothetical protein GOP47_0011703 [Adiantum capillus-veneris]